MGGPAIINKKTKEAMLILVAGDDKITLKRLKSPIDPEELETAKTRGETVSKAANVMAFTGIGIGVLGIVLQLPVMNFLIKFILIMKILNRFKLINISFGELLDQFLGGIFNIFQGGDIVIEESNFVYDTKHRGKMTAYEFEVIIFYKMIPKYIIYSVIF